MNPIKKIKSALISVYYKHGLEDLIHELKKHQITIYSTGGTQKFLEEIGTEVFPVEELTSYPSILGGRVKTLHPKVFGGILARRENQEDLMQLEEYKIPEIDLVIVDLYPFEETIKNGASEEEIIEKIDIGGVSLLRAAAKNYKDVAVIASTDTYNKLAEMLKIGKGALGIEQRKELASRAFSVTAHYDTSIRNYFASSQGKLALEFSNVQHLRYGENPHQKASFYSNGLPMVEKLSGKELSYNNLLDVDAAVQLIEEFDECTFAIIKHNNACGVASRETVQEAYLAAYQADTISPFGGVLVTNRKINKEVAILINELFFEVLIAPEFDDSAFELFIKKPNRVILKRTSQKFPETNYRSVLNGILEQEKDSKMAQKSELKVTTELNPTEAEIQDLLFANKIVKHSKSNTIVLAKNKQLLGSGLGQTSRVDALKQAILKAQTFNLSLENSSMASDAFFPFSDCVEIASQAGVKSIIQPGGSIRDKDSIEMCNKKQVSMVFSGIRHFKH
jgi:phosphoribosylaminoimidazolecarboxamide formyltransferase / IMP cyclohydrolase